MEVKKTQKKPQQPKTQQKISLYFSRDANEEVLKNKNDNTLKTVKLDNVNKSIKRKPTEDLSFNNVKIGKYDDPSGICKIYSIQKETDKPVHRLELSSDSLNCDYISTNKTKKENKGNYKENINSDVSKDGDMSIKKNITSYDNELPKQLPITECKSYSAEDCRQNSDCISNDELAKYFEDDFDEAWPDANEINFNSLQRCKVVDFFREQNSLVLIVKSTLAETSKITVRCCGFWRDSKIERDDMIMIQARHENGQWIVDNNYGFLVVHPDILISGTTIVGGIFCSRKAVLAEKFRKIESLPYQKGDQTALVIGSLVHQLLQRAVSEDICGLANVTKLMDDILQTRDTSNMLYASDISFCACRQQMLQYVPKINEFILHYIKDKNQASISGVRTNFKGTISHIRDIEENIWLPALGMKGKVDITVEVKIHAKKKIMPLEIKTGKPTFSSEHRGQIILYIMMMTLTGQDTDTGLLLYLRDNLIQEVNNGHSEKRDLILLRNTLADYLTPKHIEKLANTWPQLNLQTMKLPEPINHHSACSKCTYNALCCTYLSKDSEMQLPESHPLLKVGKQILEKIKPSHIDYILQWISILQMEETDQEGGKLNRDLWTLSPEERETKKICVSHLKVVGEIEKTNAKYKHTFVRVNAKGNYSKIPYKEFSENEYVVVSTNARLNISAGYIVQINEDFITLLIDKDITKYYFSECYHIDKYSSSHFLSFNLANVGGLICNNEICEKLRNIVIDRKPATFDKCIPRSVVHQSAKIVRELNENQQRAVLKAITMHDYILIKGMPGTGKTQTLVALIELLDKLGQSVLVTSHTNSAVDNILLKLLDKSIDFLRLGSSIHPRLKYKSEEYATSTCHTPESIEAVYSSKNIVGVTCYGAHHALLGKRTFDVCLVDECAQALQPAVLRPLYSARKFVLVGDPDQLPPIIKHKVARKLGADESLFARLDSKNNTIALMNQYRMNKEIMYLVNKLTYNDNLKAGNSTIINATLLLPRIEVLTEQPKWIQKALSADISESVIIINTGRTNKLQLNNFTNIKSFESDQINSNIWEAAIISNLVKILAKANMELSSIGIIAPYRAHVNLLRKIVDKDVEVNTVDQYQGRDKDIIIYSCAKSLCENTEIKEDLEILGDHRRLTVAVTRAKHKLIIIADKDTLFRYTAFKKLFDLVHDDHVINLNKCDSDFSWETTMSYL